MVYVFPCSDGLVACCSYMTLYEHDHAEDTVSSFLLSAQPKHEVLSAAGTGPGAMKSQRIAFPSGEIWRASPRSIIEVGSHRLQRFTHPYSRRPWLPPLPSKSVSQRRQRSKQQRGRAQPMRRHRLVPPLPPPMAARSTHRSRACQPRLARRT